ncbi:MAG: hypothetical protein R6V85_01390 [Polyangia bacterium]
MRYSVLIITVFFVIGFAVGCESSVEEKPAVEPQPGTVAAAHLDNAKDETKEAVQSLQSYAYAQRSAFFGNMTKKLVEIQAELDRLSAELDSASHASKADARAKLDAVRAKRSEAKRRLGQAKSATEAEWNAVATGVDESFGELEDSFERTRQWLSDEIEP